MSLLKSILNSLVPADPNGQVQPIAPENKYASGSPLYFPSNLEGGGGAKRYPHIMKFMIHDFLPGTERAIGPAKKTIFLHIPDNLTQTLSHDYSTESLTEAFARYGLVGAGFSDTVDLITKLVSGGEIPTLESVTSALGQSPGTLEVAGRIAESQFGAGKGSTQLLLAMGAGRSINPRYEVIYTGTRPREFTFDFKLSPKNEKESKTIIDMIKTFKYYSLPEGDQTQRYVIPPNPFTIEFLFGAGATAGQLNEALFKIGTATLEGVDVNYATAGQFATFKDGMPVEVAIQLRFKEIRALTKASIDSGY